MDRLDRVFSTQPKNWPIATRGLPFDAVGQQGWHLLRDFATPISSLTEADLQHNLTAISAWCDDLGVALAPHGKTTMSPELIHRQVAAGAWGITAATPWQAQRMVDWGVRRIVLANVCAQAEPLAALLERDVEVVTFVDSIEGLRHTAAAVGPGRRLPVLIEVGSPGGRCGVRDVAGGLALAEAVLRTPRLILRGVAAFEGTRTGRSDEAVHAVRSQIAVVRALAEALAGRGVIAGPLILSAGGSMYPDLVVEGLSGDYGMPTTLLLRSGCSLIHDHGLYATGAPARPDVRPALRVWSRVLSVPEPGWAVIDAGKRDLTAEPPARVLAVHREDGRTPLDLVIDYHNDQHGYVAFGPDAGLRVGDILELGISHPCLTFDRWTHIPLVDEQLTVVGVVRTCF